MYIYIFIHTKGAPFPHLSGITQWEAAVQMQKASFLDSGKMVRHSQAPHSHWDVKYASFSYATVHITIVNSLGPQCQY